MKKTTLTLLLALYSAIGFSQVLFESFENTTGPDSAPSTNWTLGSGNWAVFDNNVGGTVNWSINPNSYSGSKCAYMNRQNIGAGITTEEYLATPMITVPTNGKLQFYSKSFTAGNQGTLYQVKVALATNPQNVASSYNLILDEFSEDQLSPIFNIYWKKTLDLSGFAGLNIYIAFVLKYTQPTIGLTGDRFLLDDVLITDGSGCQEPSNFNVNLVSSNSSYNLNWNTDNSTTWEVLAVPCSQGFPLPNQNGIQITTNSYNFTGLPADNCYYFCVRSICDNSTTSNWSITTIPINYWPHDDCINLRAFIDNNTNGVVDLGEFSFLNGNFSHSNNTSILTEYSNSSNSSITFCAANSSSIDVQFQIKPEYSPYYSSTVSSYNNVSFNGTQTLNFPVTLTQSFTDLKIYGFKSTPIRPGFNHVVQFYYRNDSPTPINGTINFTKDPLESIVSITGYSTNITTNPSGFTYITDVLPPNYGGMITVILSVPTIPTVNFGDFLTNSATITPNTGSDSILGNNSFSETKEIVASYDPNNKTESHGGKIQFDQFTNDDYLYYTINFQNLGNASAIDVRIEDVLDSQLDESSVQMIESSHNYYMDRTASNLTWHFDNIQLLPAFVNDDLSKGFVLFKVKPKSGYTVGDIIPNTAEIYFDSNPAIITNTFNTEFVQALGTTSFEYNNVMLYPNPANNTIQISLQNTSETLSSVSITDILGKNIRTVKVTSGYQTNIDIADLSQGVYFVEITTANNLKQVKKLIKE